MSLKNGFAVTITEFVRYVRMMDDIKQWMVTRCFKPLLVWLIHLWMDKSLTAIPLSPGKDMTQVTSMGYLIY